MIGLAVLVEKENPDVVLLQEVRRSCLPTNPSIARAFPSYTILYPNRDSQVAIMYNNSIMAGTPLSLPPHLNNMLVVPMCGVDSEYL